MISCSLVCIPVSRLLSLETTSDNYNSVSLFLWPFLCTLSKADIAACSAHHPLFWFCSSCKSVNFVPLVISLFKSFLTSLNQLSETLSVHITLKIFFVDPSLTHVRKILEFLSSSVIRFSGILLLFHIAKYYSSSVFGPIRKHSLACVNSLGFNYCSIVFVVLFLLETFPSIFNVPKVSLFLFL